MGKLDGKVAVVTGGTAGIGKGITRVFLEDGAKVVFCGRRAEKGEAIERELRDEGFDVTFVRADMTVSADIENLLDATLKAYGHVDILVNNAGVMHQVSMMNLDMAKDYDAVMNVNLRAYFETITVIGSKIGKGGSIINIASIGGIGGAYPVATYGASKAAVISLTKSCAKEVAAAGVRVNAICPGVIFSEMMDPESEFTKMSVSMVPMGRGGQPREIGTVASFLASDEASFVTGDYIVVDGGQTA